MKSISLLLVTVSAIKLDSVPSCNSYECKKDTAAANLVGNDIYWTAPGKHPKNYFVPDFGVDKDIEASL